MDPFVVAAIAVASGVFTPLAISFVSRLVRPKSEREEGVAEKATQFSVTLMARIDQLEQKQMRLEKAADAARAEARHAEQRADEAEKSHAECEARVDALVKRIERLESGKS